ncbi:hypothetical protein GF322_01790 [Candidatus Dependentiae bacterium]|nr:hypothetical protein [Candidatus Dependentiae bacterium]
MIKILFSRIQLREEAKILNIGGGIDEGLFILKKFGKVYVVDIDSNALNLIPKYSVEEKKLVIFVKLHITIRI